MHLLVQINNKKKMPSIYIQIIGASCFDPTQNQPSENLTIHTKGNQPEFSLNLCLAPVSLNAFQFAHFWTHALCRSRIPSHPKNR